MCIYFFYYTRHIKSGTSVKSSLNILAFPIRILKPIFEIFGYYSKYIPVTHDSVLTTTFNVTGFRFMC